MFPEAHYSLALVGVGLEMRGMKMVGFSGDDVTMAAGLPTLCWGIPAAAAALLTRPPALTSCVYNTQHRCVMVNAGAAGKGGVWQTDRQTDGTLCPNAV